jgi:hypothetical protein
MLLCGAERDRAIRVALQGAGIHLTFTSLTSAYICVAVGVRFDRSYGAGVISDDLKGDINEGDESSGACRCWRIAHSCCSSRAGPSAVAGQSRRRRGGPGKLKAGDDRSALESPLAPPSSLLALPLMSVG